MVALAQVNAEALPQRSVSYLVGVDASGIAGLMAYNFGATPETYGAVGDGVADDTLAVQAAFNASPLVAFRPGAVYKVTSSIVMMLPKTFIFGNRGQIKASFGTNYSRPAITNNKATDASLEFDAQDFLITGNCVAFDLRFTADNPNAGLRFRIRRVNLDTGDGNRRTGTAFLVADQFDFSVVEDCGATNCDANIVIKSSGTRRNSTQVRISNFYGSQVKTGAVLAGLDKAKLEGVDFSACNSGFSFEGSNSRVKLERCHVEGIGQSAYPSQSSYALAAALGIGYAFHDGLQHKDIELEKCSAIDLGGTGSVAVAGVFVGTCSNPSLESIHFEKCSFASTMGDSAGYKPIKNRGIFSWSGEWPYSTQADLSANGASYISTRIRDDVQGRVNAENILVGSTLYSLYSGADMPTLADEPDSATSRNGVRVTFTKANTDFATAQNLPQGWNTLIVSGYRVSGNVVLFVQQNGGAFTDLLRVQFVGTSERIWCIAFYNGTANQNCKIGMTNQNASGDVAVVSKFCTVKGFGQDIPDVRREIVGTLPVASARYRGQHFVLRASGAQDVRYTCELGADGTTYSWVTY